MAIPTVSPIVSSLAWLQNRPIAEMFTKEVLGTNVPKSLMTRSLNERIDVASDQFGGTLSFFGSGLALHYGLDALYKAINPNVLKQTNANLWRIAGKSAAIFAVQTALYWAIPFLRDYITARRTGKESFTHVIGAEEDRPDSLKDDRFSSSVESKIKYYKRMFLQTTGIGIAVAAAAVGLTAVAVAKNRPFKNTGATKWLMSEIALGEGKLSKYPRWAQFFFVALASYVGRFHAVRDQYELKEQLLHFSSFLFGWFIPPLIFERIYGNQLNKMIQDKNLLKKVTEGKTSLDFNLIKKHLGSDHPELFKKAQRLFAKQQIFGLAFSIVVLSLLPPFINFGLTEARLKRAKEEKAATAAQTRTPQPKGEPPLTTTDISSSLPSSRPTIPQAVASEAFPSVPGIALSPEFMSPESSSRLQQAIHAQSRQPAVMPFEKVTLLRSPLSGFSNTLSAPQQDILVPPHQNVSPTAIQPWAFNSPRPVIQKPNAFYQPGWNPSP